MEGEGLAAFLRVLEDDRSRIGVQTGVGQSLLKQQCTIRWRG